MKIDSSDIRQAFLPGLDKLFGSIVDKPDHGQVKQVLSTLILGVLDLANERLDDRENRIRQMDYHDGFEISTENKTVNSIRAEFTIITTHGAFSLRYKCDSNTSDLQVKSK